MHEYGRILFFRNQKNRFIAVEHLFQVKRISTHRIVWMACWKCWFHAKQSRDLLTLTVVYIFDVDSGLHPSMSERCDIISLFKWNFETLTFSEPKRTDIMCTFIDTFLFSTRPRWPYAWCRIAHPPLMNSTRANMWHRLAKRIISRYLCDCTVSVFDRKKIGACVGYTHFLCKQLIFLVRPA